MKEKACRDCEYFDPAPHRCTRPKTTSRDDDTLLINLDAYTGEYTFQVISVPIDEERTPEATRNRDARCGPKGRFFKPKTGNPQ